MTHDSPQPDDRLPERLQRDLRALFGRTPEVPGHLDQAILTPARRRRTWRWAVGSAIAAAIAMAAGGLWLYTPHTPTNPVAVGGSHGYRKTGDIRDAFFLARELKAGLAPGRQWDANGDGVIDQRDVNTLALAAVKLDHRGGLP